MLVIPWKYCGLGGEIGNPDLMFFGKTNLPISDLPPETRETENSTQTIKKIKNKIK